VAAKRGKSQARRNSSRDGGGLPGWAWLVLGVVLTIGVVLAAPKLLRSGAGDGFFRPKPNPDAQPVATHDGDDAVVPDEDTAASARGADAKAKDPAKPTQYDFYTMLPGNEVVMSDAELAATAREEAARHPTATATTATTAASAAADAAPVAADRTLPTAAPAVATVAPAPTATTPATSGNDAPYLLQAGAFGGSGDAEATKAKVALLGLSARVESAAINGKTVYRVRMGPYGTASELAEAKRKLANGGLPAMAIKVK
jgi:cell division protein FtsN